MYESMVTFMVKLMKGNNTQIVSTSGTVNFNVPVIAVAKAAGTYIIGRGMFFLLKNFGTINGNVKWAPESQATITNVPRPKM